MGRARRDASFVCAAMSEITSEAGSGDSMSAGSAFTRCYLNALYRNGLWAPFTDDALYGEEPRFFALTLDLPATACDNLVTGEPQWQMALLGGRKKLIEISGGSG